MISPGGLSRQDPTMLKVLITNIWLTGLGGSETYVRELALELKRRGHLPMVYSPAIDERTKALFPGITVVDDLKDLPCKPEIIHGHHREPVSTAAAFFPDVPVIFVSHSAADFLSRYEMPEASSRVARYVAVDQLVKTALLTRAKTPPEKTLVIYNFADTDRFLPRSPLPQRPKKALVFSNYTFQDAVKKERLKSIRAACEKAGLSLDVMGMGTDRYTPHPESELARYDIVFAKAKSALEALAVGNAVILCDCLFGVGEMVSEKNFERCRSYNFGNYLLSKPFDIDVLLEEIQKYNPASAAKTMEITRSRCNLSSAVDELIALYTTVIDESGSSWQGIGSWLRARPCLIRVLQRIFPDG
jgi:hypothetical protein